MCNGAPRNDSILLTFNLDIRPWALLQLKYWVRLRGSRNTLNGRCVNWLYTLPSRPNLFFWAQSDRISQIKNVGWMMVYDRTIITSVKNTMRLPMSVLLVCLSLNRIMCNVFKRFSKQVAQLWQRDRATHDAILTGWVTLRLNFRLKGYVSR